MVLFSVPWVTQAQTLPINDDFEGTTSWTFVNGTLTNQWCVGTATSNGGTHAMYISNNSGTSNAYTTSSSAVVFAYKEVSLAVGQYEYSYDWKCNGESTYDFIRVALVPSTVTLTAGTTLPSGLTYSAMPSGWTAMDGGSKLNLQTTWQHFSSDFNITTAGTYKVVFVWRNDGSAGNQPPAAIDNFHLAALTCPRPTNLTESNVTASSATLSWTAGASETSWQYLYDTTGFTPDWTSATSTTSTSVSLTGLSPNTSYTFYVRSYCSATDQSDVTVLTFRTACTAYSLPYRENFENQTANTVVSCWDNSMSTTSTLSSNPHYVWGVYAYNGNNMIRMYNWYVQSGIAAINTPQIILPSGGSYQLKFDYAHNSSSGDLLIKVSSDFGTTFTTIDTLTQGTGTSQTDPGTFTPATYDLSAFAGDTILVQFYNNANYGNGAIFLDNIVVRVTPTCLDLSDVAVNDITSSGATVSWTAGSASQNSFTVAYGTGNDPDSMNTISATTTSATLTGLEANTSYNIFVRAICSASDQSEWTNMTTFRTECNYVDEFPYTEDFNSYETGSSASISSCWHKGTNHTTAYPYPYSYSTNSIDGTNYLYFYGYHTSAATSCKYSYAALPRMDTSISNLMLTFQMKRYNSTITSYTSYLIVGVMSNPNNINTFVGYDTIDLTTATPNSIHDIEVAFNNYTGTEGSIAFYCPDIVPSTATGTYGTNYVSIDNVVVDLLPSCWTVTNLAVDTTTQNSVTLSWTERNTSANQWSVSYVAAGSTQLTSTIVNSNPATITGLTGGNLYTFYVSPICAAGDTANAKSVMGRTACPNNFSAPFFENFEGYTNVSTSYYNPTTAQGYPNLLPACWPTPVISATSSSSGSSTLVPVIFMTNSSSYVRDNAALAMKGYSTNKPAVIALPLFTNDLNTLQIDLDYRQYVSSYGNLQLGVMTNPSDTTTFTALEALPRTNTYSHATHDFSLDTNLPSADTLYIALRHIQGSTSASYCSFVDNISVTLAPTCKTPINVALDTATETSATLGWNMPLTYTASSYTVAYGDSDFDGEDTNTWMGSVSSTTMSATLTGLEGGTTYYAAVRSNCSATDHSSWSETYIFNTACPASRVIDATHSLVEGFDGTTVNPCWTIIYADSANATINPVITTAETGSNGNCLRFSSYSRNNNNEYHQYAVSPEFSSTSRMTLSFRQKVYDSYDTLWYGISSTTGDLSSFNWVVLPTTTSFTTVEVDLPANTKHVAFQYNGDCQYYGYIDDVVVSTVPQYNVIALVNDTLMGTVTGTTGLLYAGTVDTLVAEANANYHFVDWSNGLTTDTISFTVTGDTTFTANFAPDTFAISLAVNDSTMGSVTGAGNYAYNTQATLVATAAEHYHFVNWNDGDTNATRVITVTGNASYTANFAINQYTVTVNVNDATMGSVEGAGTYDYGTLVTLTATANDHYYFDNWSNGESGNVMTFCITSDTTFTANFVLDVYTVTVNSDNDTMGYVTGTGAYAYGETDTLTATPYSGFHFVRWNDGDTNATRYVVIECDTVFTAYFEANEEPEGIREAEAGNFTVSSEALRIVVKAAEGQQVSIYDVNGRMLHQTLRASEMENYAVPTTGLYLVKVGNYPARRVIVVR